MLYNFWECRDLLLGQSLTQPAIKRYWRSNLAVTTLTFQDKSLVTLIAAFLWHYLPESSNYYESWWLNKHSVLSIKNMLWTFTACQTPGDAEITKTNTACKTESSHTFEKVSFHKWAYSGAFRKADCMTNRVCEANNTNSPHHQGSCPPWVGGCKYCFQNPWATSPYIIYDLCSKKFLYLLVSHWMAFSSNQQAF